MFLLAKPSGILFSKIILFCLLGTQLLSASFSSLFEERSKSLVAIEYYVQEEEDRSPAESMGLVLDEEGLLLLLNSSIPNWVPVERLKDFKVFNLGSSGEGFSAEYLGEDMLNGWHYLRVEPAGRKELKAISSYETSAITYGQELWGIGVQTKELDYKPYFLSARVSLEQKLPLDTVFFTAAIAIPAGPVFDMEGRLAGWAIDSFPEQRILYTNNNRMRIALTNPRESSAILSIAELLENIGRVPLSPEDDTRPWLGVAGMQAVDDEAAEYLGISEQGAIVISDVIENSPAGLAGLEDGDIILGFDGTLIPKLRPNPVMTEYFERAILQKKLGENFELKVLRGTQTLQLSLTIEPGPKLQRSADRQYFSGLGLTIREFVLSDAIQRRIEPSTRSGVIASFVKANSPVNTAGLRHGDWIQEIDGIAIENYENAASILEQIQADENRREFVMLVNRNNETTLMRVKLFQSEK